MKRPTTATFATMALLAFVHGAQAQLATDPNTMVVELSDPGRTATVDVRTPGGAITIRPHDDANVRIMADDDVFGVPEEREGLRRLTLSPLRVEEEGNVVTIRGDIVGGTDLLIFVPAATNLRLESMNDGIDVEGIRGDIEATSMNDTVRLTDVGGIVVAHSQNDDVVVVMTTVAADTPMAFTSVNGDVDVTLPTSVRATVSARTVNGDIYTGFDELETAPADLDSNEPNDAAGNAGRLRYRFRMPERAISGALNGGGPEFEFRSVNGDVMIRRGN